MTGTARAILLVTLPALLLMAACGDDDGGTENQPVASTPAEVFQFGLASQTVAGIGTADNVSAMAFAPDGRLFYAEQFRPGTSDGAGSSTAAIRIVNIDGSVQAVPFAEITVADWLGLDWGLTGLAIDPDFENTGQVYAFYTQFVRTETVELDDGTTTEAPVGRPVIVRFTDSNGTATEETVVTDDFPETDPRRPGYNANGELHFGPDGRLYASVGDYDLFSANPEAITDLATPIGKLLRMNPDGSAAGDNPFFGSETADERVFAYGFREPFPFTFGEDGTIYGTDNTTVSCEELNVIEPGGNYGWPFGAFPFDDCTAGQGEQAIHYFTREGLEPNQFISFVEVSGLSFLQGSSYGQLGDGLIACESQESAGPNEEASPGALRRLILPAPTTVAESQLIVNVCGGATTTRDGVVYFATDNEIRKLIESQEPAAEPTDAS